jgi:hypothetical protein
MEEGYKVVGTKKDGLSVDEPKNGSWRLISRTLLGKHLSFHGDCGKDESGDECGANSQE